MKFTCMSKDFADSIKAAVALGSEKWREGEKGRGAWWVVVFLFGFLFFIFCKDRHNI